MMHILPIVEVPVSEYIEDEPCCITVSIEYEESRFCRESEPKWIDFCKEHHFHPVKDAYGKIYDLYLELCAEGMV